MSALLDPTGSDGRRSPLGRAMTLVWVAVFGAGMASALWNRAPLWAWIVAGVGLLAWAAYALLPVRTARARPALELVLVVCGGVTAVPTNLVGSIALAAGITFAIRRAGGSLRWPVTVVAVGLVAAAAGLGIAPLRPDREWIALVLLGVFAIAVLLGFVRRQAAQSDLRARELAAERDRVARLDDHARVARDLHDVLAHGLGGLVVQLDAVDALLEGGRVTDAQQRVRAARTLAREGLVDARRAVDALRSDGEGPPVDAAVVAEQLDELVQAHRGLGGQVDARIDVGKDTVPAATATALRRGLQESLSNARKHAAGERVLVVVDRVDDRVRMTVENAVGTPTALAGSGGGRGLAGMRERFDRLEGGQVEAGAEDGRFRVHAEALVGETAP